MALVVILTGVNVILAARDLVRLDLREGRVSSLSPETRSLIKTPDRYDPEPNRTYEEFARHYGCAVLAARPAHPRDKALYSYCTSCRM